ncbi:glutamine amidotransferase [Streptococcus pasteurianus]|nr:glutamine amidotransferase [Streptococcus pasteurianus]
MVFVKELCSVGEAYGASVERSPEKEIGNYPITLTEAGLANRNLSHIGTSAIVGHWHGDMPGLTPQAKILATSQGCPRQIVKYSDKHYAFQCHLEFSKPLIEALLAEEVDYDEQVKTCSYLQVANEMLAYDYSEMNHILEQFLDAFTK